VFHIEQIDNEILEKLQLSEQDLNLEWCFTRHNNENELESIPENMVEITHLLMKLSDKYRKVFKCLFEGCNTICSKYSTLEKHYKMHSNLKPFGC
jgi:hypothetical protein